MAALNSISLLSGFVLGNPYSTYVTTGSTLIVGSIYSYDTVAQAAYQAAISLFRYLSLLPCDGQITSPNQIFTTGVWCYHSTIAPQRFLNFTFDAQGDPTVIFVLSIAGNLQGRGGQMTLINDAQACNIFVLVSGSIQPLFNLTLYGIWLVRGNIEPLANVVMQGKFISVGPGASYSGIGNINMVGSLTLRTCQCFVRPATVAPTVGPTSSPTVAPPITQSQPDISLLISACTIVAVGFILLIVSVSCPSAR